jgi:predicted nucleic acid-binding protein
MNVLADTSIWSLALRRERNAPSKVADELRNLIADDRIEMIGPIRQELLSGIRTKAQFEKLETHLAAFPDVPITTEDHVTAARFFNRCRGKGVQASHTDFLICAVASRRSLTIYSTDKDFELFAKYLPIVLHRV